MFFSLHFSSFLTQLIQNKMDGQDGWFTAWGTIFKSSLVPKFTYILTMLRRIGPNVPKATAIIYFVIVCVCYYWFGLQFIFFLRLPKTGFLRTPFFLAVHSVRSLQIEIKIGTIIIRSRPYLDVIKAGFFCPYKLNIAR